MGFTDLMTSGRGPGVIGILLALVVLLGFGTLFMFAFDDGMQGADQSIESVIRNQGKEIDDLKSSIEARGKQLGEAPKRQENARELSTIKRENTYREGEIESLRKGITSANETIKAKLAEIEDYKNEYRTFVRGKAKGTTLEKLETRDGEVYMNVSVRDVNAVGMQVIHDGGQIRIPFENLPPDIQDFYQFDAAQKADMIAEEQKERDIHEKAVGVAQEVARDEADRMRQLEEKKKKERAAVELAKSLARIETLDDEIEGLQKALELEVKKKLSRAPQMRAQLAAKQRELSNLQQKVAAMERL